MQVAAFIAERNLSLSISSSQLDVLKATAPKDTKESMVLKEIQMAATKSTNIIRQGTGLYLAQDLVQTLRSSKFSIIPDETT